MSQQHPDQSPWDPQPRQLDPTQPTQQQHVRPLQPAAQPWPATPQTAPPAAPYSYDAPAIREYTTTIGGGSTSAHIVHGILTLVSLLAWSPVWITYAICTRKRTATIRLLPTGTVEVIQH